MAPHGMTRLLAEIIRAPESPGLKLTSFRLVRLSQVLASSIAAEMLFATYLLIRIQ